MKPVQKQIFKRNFYEETQKVNPMRKHMTTQSESDGPIHYIRMLLAAQTHPLANTSSLISHCVAFSVIFQYLQLSFPCMEDGSYQMHRIDDISANCVQYILQIGTGCIFRFFSFHIFPTLLMIAGSFLKQANGPTDTLSFFLD